MAVFGKIDTDWREDRSKRSVKEINAMKSWFEGKTYDAASESFHAGLVLAAAPTGGNL